jgi:hypothetical protein
MQAANDNRKLRRSTDTTITLIVVGVAVAVLAAKLILLWTPQEAYGQELDVMEQFIIQQLKEDTAQWFAMDAYNLTQFTAYNEGMNVTIKVQQMGLEYAHEATVSQHFQDRGYFVTEYTPYMNGTILIKIANSYAYYQEGEGPSGGLVL